MNLDIYTLLANVIITPCLVLFTMVVKSSLSKSERQARREDGFIEELKRRVDTLEHDIRTVRAELKNRDEEYVEIYKKHATLRAQYDVLLADHDKLKKDYGETATELATLKDDIKKKAEEAARQMQKI